MNGQIYESNSMVLINKFKIKIKLKKYWFENIYIEYLINLNTDKKTKQGSLNIALILGFF